MKKIRPLVAVTVALALVVSGSIVMSLMLQPLESRETDTIIRSIGDNQVAVSPSTLLQPSMSFDERVFAASDNGSSSRALSVSGIGNAQTAPDSVVVMLSLTTEGTTSADAVTFNGEIFSSALDGLGRLGIDRDQIETTSYNLVPTYSRPSREGPLEITGYRVLHDFAVTIRDPRLNELSRVAGQVVDVSAAAGVNGINGIQFSASQETFIKLRNEALVAAAQDANLKAQIIAESLGVRIVSVLSASESGIRAPMVVMQRTMAEASVAALTDVIPGQLEVRSHVSVAYEIGPM